MFQFPGLAFNPYVFRAKYLHLKTGNPKPKPRFRGRNLGVPVFEGGFPHSEISGSKLIRSSPKLIAAYHVLLRLLAPRHPPNALKTLDRSHRRCPPLGRGHPCGNSPGQLAPPGKWIDGHFEKTSFALSRRRCGQHPTIASGKACASPPRPDRIAAVQSINAHIHDVIKPCIFHRKAHRRSTGMLRNMQNRKLTDKPKDSPCCQRSLTLPPLLL